MKNIQYISASAGSGKTYRLTEDLANGIQSGEITPEKVILTTFTVKAAEEFKERAKEKLYERGLHEEASRLDQALIGTVHSIANSLINKYWYLLGMSPSLKVMSDEDVSFYKSQSLSSLASRDELNFLKAFAEDFEIKYDYNSGKYGINYDFWTDVLSRVVEFAETYQLDDFSKSLEYSLSLVDKIYEGTFTVDISDDEIDELLENFILINAQGRQSGASEKRKAAAEEMLRKLRGKKRGISFYQALASTLATFSTNDFVCPQKQSMQERLDKLWQSDLVKQTLKRFIKLVFDFAQKWRVDYAEYKKRRQVIDYSDMETLLIKLLKEYPQVREDISKTYSHLFVDEFQDSSPIQIKIFDSLSDCVQKSVWVGDYKQAIYGFRGTDTELVKAVTDIIAKGKNGNQTLPPLDTSWRSLDPIVDTVNKTFVPLFSDILKEDQVALNADRKAKKSDKCLLFWNLEGTNAEGRSESLAQKIAAKISQNLPPKEIAVLARNNKELDNLAKELKNYDVPVLREEGGDGEQKEVTLVNALLSLVANPSDTLARAQIAYLSEPGYGAAEILDKKLLHNSEEGKKDSDFLCDIPLIKKVLERKEDYKCLSVKSLVESLVIELNLCSIAKGWSDSGHSEQIFDSIVEAARTYEDHCVQMSLPATIYGFISYSSERIKFAGDAEGVRLFTFHGSKGLEWENVVLTSLNNNPCKEDDLIRKNFYGVRVARKQAPAEANLFPEVLISVFPWVFGSKKNIQVQDIKARVLQHEDYGKIKSETLSEEKRLMYVAMTRPRDCLILALSQSSPLLRFESLGAPVDQSGVASAKADLLACGNVFYKDEPELASEGWKFKKQNALAFVVKNECGGTQFEPRDIQPSGAAGGKVEPTLFENISPRISLGTTADMQVVGTCVHNIFCVIENWAQDEALAQAKVAEYIKSFGLEKELPNAGQIIDSWKGLSAHLQSEYGDSVKNSHELPFKFMQDGQIATGSIDLLWQTKDGAVLVDYKTFPGSKEQILDEAGAHYVGKYKGQFALYEKALKLSGIKVVARVVYYPVAGLAVSF